MAKLVSNGEDNELSSVIRKLLSEKGLTVGSLAEFTGVKTSTIRNWIQRNKFPREHLQIIAQEIGLEGGIEEIESKYTFEWSDSTRNNSDNETFRDIVESIRFGRISFNESVNRLFSKLGKNDNFYYMSSTQIPFEMDSDTSPDIRENLYEIIANASLKGASFRYIFPEEKKVEEGGVPTYYSYGVWDSSFNMLLRRVVFYQKQQNQNSSEFPANKNVTKWLSDSRYLVPFHKLILFKIADQEVPNEFEYFAFSYSDTDTKSPAHYPLKVRAVEQIREFVEALEKEKEKEAKEEEKNRR